MDTVSVSLEVLGGLLGKTTVELQSALMIEGNDGKKIFVDQSNIDKFVADNLRLRLSEQKDAGRDENISRGKRSGFDEVEKHLTETFGIKKGTDWRTAIGQVVTDAKSKTQTTDEEVKSSQVYKDLDAKLQAAETAHQATKKEFREHKVNESFERELLAVLADESLALALPDDATIKGNQIKSFKALIGSIAKLEPNERGEIIPLDEKGKQLEDANFIPVSLKSFISNNAKTFWPAKSNQPERQAPPAGQPNGQGGDGGAPSGNKFPTWKSAQEFSDFTDKAMLEGKDVAYIKEATAAYESQPK